MNIETYHISTDRNKEWNGPRRYLRIYVYDTDADLQAAGAKHQGDKKDVKREWEGVGGCFHASRFVVDHWAGIIRLSKQCLCFEGVIHECVHAANEIYRLDVKERIDLGTRNNHREETHAYIIGDLSQALIDVLRANELL